MKRRRTPRTLRIFTFQECKSWRMLAAKLDRSEGFHARERQKGPVRAIVEGDLFLSARSFFSLSFFFFLSSLTQNRALKNMIFVGKICFMSGPEVQNIVAHQNTASVTISFTITFPITTSMKFGMTLQHVVSTR